MLEILLALLVVVLALLVAGLMWGMKNRNLFYREYQEQKLKRTGKQKVRAWMTRLMTQSMAGLYVKTYVHGALFVKSHTNKEG